MRDIIQISKLRVETHIGIHAWEQKILQTLLIDINIPIDLSLCENDLSKTLDYSRICEEVTNHVATNAFSLIETVSEQVFFLIKDLFSVSSLSVTVSKPHAISNAENISVTIAR